MPRAFVAGRVEDLPPKMAGRQGLCRFSAEDDGCEKVP